MTELLPQYHPKDVEESRYQWWESQGLFHAEPLDAMAIAGFAAPGAVAGATTAALTHWSVHERCASGMADALLSALPTAAALGVADPARAGVGGHSYGAFMTANLLAHSELFRAGCARSGAYNRTLTPFGFQSERRSLWEAPEVYWKMSPSPPCRVGRWMKVMALMSSRTSSPVSLEHPNAMAQSAMLSAIRFTARLLGCEGG